MTPMQHRNHVTDGDYPWPGCPYCREFIIEPAIREIANEYRTGRSYELLLDKDD